MPPRLKEVLRVVHTAGQELATQAAPVLCDPLRAPAARALAATQPILRLQDGSQVVRLSGGIIPLYAAMGVEDAGEVIGPGYTPEAAARALTLGRR